MGYLLCRLGSLPYRLMWNHRIPEVSLVDRAVIIPILLLFLSYLPEHNRNSPQHSIRVTTPISLFLLLREVYISKREEIFFMRSLYFG